MAEKQKVNIILDASKIDLFETCPARYNFRYNLNRTLPIKDKASALDLGTLAHEGLAVYFKMLKDQKHYDDRIEAMKMKIRAFNADPNQSNSDEEEVSNLIRCVEEHCDYWRSEDENCLEILNVEEPFAYVLYEDDEIRIIISGKIDLLVNFRSIGGRQNYERMPIDHKTFSRDSTVYRKSNQFINYCAAVESDYLVVNRIGLYPAGSNKKQEERYKRIPISYDPIYIQDWKNNLTRMLLQEYLTCVAQGTWPEKPTSCNKFNRRCEYYDICDSSGQEAKLFKLESQYVIAPEWDVTKDMAD